jgi:hypothetical protein
MTSLVVLILAAFACGGLVVFAASEHRRVVAARGRLLDEAGTVLDGTVIRRAPDGFPVATGRDAGGRRVQVGLIADTMVTRRLPQLWLSVRIEDPAHRDRPTIGAISRPTGSEYFSAVHELPEWVAPSGNGTPMIIRSDGRATARQTERSIGCFNRLFADARIKEAMISPAGVRVLCQASEGDRAAHMFLRQVRFPLERVPANAIRRAIAIACDLGIEMTEPDPVPTLEPA